jgi:hypothetical protein
MVWENTTRRYELRNARIVAAIDGGGAMIETGDFVYEEGRHPTRFSDDGTGDPPWLELFYGFSVIDAPTPDATESVEARILIDGDGEAGRMEIRGNGWIGYDENGFVNGWFETPPKMLLDHGAKMPDWPVDPKRGELSFGEWMAHMEATKPRTSAEYDRATRSRDGIDKDWPGALDVDDDDDED